VNFPTPVRREFISRVIALDPIDRSENPRACAIIRRYCKGRWTACSLAGERWPTTLVRLPHDPAGQEAPDIVQGRGCGRSWDIASRRAGSPTQPRSSALRGAARLIALPVDMPSLRMGRQGGPSASGAWRMRSTVWLCLSPIPHGLGVARALGSADQNRCRWRRRVDQSASPPSSPADDPTSGRRRLNCTSVTVPIFAGGRLKHMLEPRKSQQQEATIGYQKTLMQAWHKVVNELVIYRLEQQCLTQLKLPIELPASALWRQHSDGIGDFSRCAMPSGRFCRRAAVTSITNVSLNLTSSSRRSTAAGDSLPEFARYQDLTLAVMILLGAISRKRLLNCEHSATRKLLGLPTGEPTRIFWNSIL
jgi:hypothetical protein